MGGHLGGESATNYTVCLPRALPATLSSFLVCGHYAWPPWGVVESRNAPSSVLLLWGSLLLHGWVPSPPKPPPMWA